MASQTSICNRALECLGDAARVHAVFMKHMLDNCKNGLSTCDPLQLSPADISAVALAAKQRNLERCVKGLQGCDPSLLTAPEFAAVARSHQQKRGPASRR